MAFGLGYWHWFFLAQPYDLPERLIGTDPTYFFLSRPERSAVFAPEALEEYLRCFRDPRTVHVICEDYRAAATLDFAHDEADRREEKRITCPMLALWGRQGNLDEWYDVVGIWRGWADDVRGRGLRCGHYLPEEVPGETYSELRTFFKPGQSASL
jgi:haloacetate dehalogenase